MASIRPAVRVGDHQGHAGEPGGDQAPQERRPARPVLGGDEVEAENLSVPPALTPVATTTATLTMRPPSRTLG
jgi:hypothetical protein